MLKKQLLLSLVVLTALSTISCSSFFMRKSCEKINWFDHAKNVAMSGKRLTEDARLRECQKAETEINDAELDKGFKKGMGDYCTPETALLKGANGDGFNYDFCDSSIGSRLKAQHTAGLKKFCAPDMAFSFGSTGGVYNSQCPKDMEGAYLPKYRKGRRIYLKNQIEKNDGLVMGLEGEIQNSQRQRSELNARMALLPQRSVVTKNKQFNAATGTYQETSAVTEDPAIKSQRESIEGQLRQLNSQIQSKLDKQKGLREENAKFKSEMEGLN